MKLISIFLYTLLSHFQQQDTTGLYQIQFADLDNGAVISMSNYTGRQLIIIDCSAANPNRQQLKSLDTLYRNSNGQFTVIAIPVQDTGSFVQRDSLRSLLRDTLALSFIISDIAQKTEDAVQHPLLEWLTTVDENLRFNDNTAENGEMFVISGTGILYFALHKDFITTDVLMQSISGNQPPGH